MSNVPQVNEIPPSTADRRVHPREKMSALAYVDLGPANGGMLLNLSEGGLALATASRLVGDELSGIRFELPDLADRIEVRAKVAWRAESKKEAGIKFVELPPAAAEAIKTWISSKQHREQDEKESQRKANIEPLETFDVTDPALPPREIRPAPVETAPESAESVAEAVLAIRTRPDTQPRQGESGVAMPITAERRTHQRGAVTSLAYVDLGLGNGGRLLNLSESGLALTAVVKVMGKRLESLRFELPNFEDWVEARGRIIWRSDSEKEVGVQFEQLSEDALAKIRKWVSTGAATEGLTATDTPAPRIEEMAKPQKHPEFAGSLASHSGTPRRDSRSAALKPPVQRASMERINQNVFPRRVAKSIRKQIPAVTGAKNLTSFAVITASVAVISFVAGIAIEQRGRPVSQESVKVAAVLKQKAQSMKDAQAVSSGANASPQAGLTDTQQANASQGSALTQPPTKTQPPTDSSLRTSDGKTVSQAKPASQPAAGSTHTQKANVARQSAGNSPGKQTGAPQRQTNSVAPQTSALKTSSQTAAKGSTDAHQAQVTTQRTQPESTLQSTARPQTPVASEIAHSQAAAASSPGGPDTASVAAPTNNKEAGRVPAPPSSTANVPASAVSVKPSITTTMAPFPSLRIPAELKPAASRLGKSLEIGQLISRIEPTYPAEAASQRIEGTVKVHATIGRDGTIQTIVANGPRLLAEAAKNAVQQWRYKPTLLGGQAIEADQDIVVVFRLSAQDPGSK